MNHYFHNIGEDWFSYQDFYSKMVEIHDDDAIFVELGCWKGRSTCFMGVEIINSGKDIKLCAVDSWCYRPNTEQPCSNQREFDEVFHEFLHNIKPIREVVDTYVMDSAYAAEAFEDETVDFIFFDASHYKNDLINDIKAWLPKMKKNGIMAGHDYFTYCHPGVKEAVEECFTTYETDEHMNLWITRKGNEKI